MNDEHPTGYIDLTGPNQNQDPAPEPPMGPAAPSSASATPGPAPTEEADVMPAPANLDSNRTNSNRTDSGKADSNGNDSDDAQDEHAPFHMGAMPDLRETPEPDSPEGKSREEFTTVYDILDQLEAALDDAKSSMFSPGQVKVDREEFTDQLCELKKMLPVQLERASALMREAERRLESAQTQANAIVSSAQSRAADMVKEANEQAQFLAGQENVTELARQKARTILEQAQAKSDHLTQGADQYCTTVMEGLSQQLGKLSQDVRAGMNVLEERQRSAGEKLPGLTIDDYPEAQ